jgi:hypothetical protein
MKRIVFVAMISSLLLAQPPIVSAVQFTDTGSLSGDLLEAVTTLSNQGIIRGYADNTFRPQQSISEKEWGLLVSRTVHSTELDGLSDDPISRIGALYLLAATWDIDWSKESLARQFADVFSDSNTQIVNYFARLNVIHGRTTTTFAPEGYLTRAEAAKILLLAQRLLLGPSSASRQFSESVVLTPSQVNITQNVVEIIDVSPLSLSPGQIGTLFFTIKNNGDLETGLQEGSDYRASVLSGDVRILEASELGNGLYQVTFQASTNAAAGPINIQITAFMGSVFSTTLNEFLQQNAQANVTAPSVSLARLVPNRLYSNQTAQILVTPQGIGGAPVTGLEISAEVTKGSGTIIAPVTESPVGSGVYIGTYQAMGSARQDVEITVRINNIASTPQTIIRGTIM